MQLNGKFAECNSVNSLKTNTCREVPTDTFLHSPRQEGQTIQQQQIVCRRIIVCLRIINRHKNCESGAKKKSFGGVEGRTEQNNRTKQQNRTEQNGTERNGA